METKKSSFVYLKAVDTKWMVCFIFLLVASSNVMRLTLLLIYSRMHNPDVVQVGYEHKVPKAKTTNVPQKRLALIFRQGEKRFFSKDTGQPLSATVGTGPILSAPLRRPSTTWGPMAHILQEGNIFYSRLEMMANYTHVRSY